MFLSYIMKISSLGVNQILYFGFDPNLLLHGIDFWFLTNDLTIT